MVSVSVSVSPEVFDGGSSARRLAAAQRTLSLNLLLVDAPARRASHHVPVYECLRRLSSNNVIWYIAKPSSDFKILEDLLPHDSLENGVGVQTKVMYQQTVCLSDKL